LEPVDPARVHVLRAIVGTRAFRCPALSVRLPDPLIVTRLQGRDEIIPCGKWVHVGKAALRTACKPPEHEKDVTLAGLAFLDGLGLFGPILHLQKGLNAVQKVVHDVAAALEGLVILASLVRETRRVRP